MKLTEILAISGTPGLHRYVAQGRGGIIVESLVDGKRAMVSGSAKVSALGDIAVFTTSEEVPLADIFTSIFKKNNGKAEALNNKSDDKEVVAFFSAVLPEYDKDRVHLSDVKKIANWYNILVGAGMTEFVLEDETAEAPAEVAQVEEVKEEEKAVKKPAVKKTASAATAAAKKTAATKAAGTPKATGAKVKATKSTNIRKSQ